MGTKQRRCSLLPTRPGTGQETAATTLPSCDEYWRARASTAVTVFGRLLWCASFYDAEAKQYRGDSDCKEYPAEVSAAMLSQMHRQAFADWLSLTLEEQRNDLAACTSSSEGCNTERQFHRRELGRLVPRGASPEEIELFHQDYALVASVAMPFTAISEPSAPALTDETVLNAILSAMPGLRGGRKRPIRVSHGMNTRWLVELTPATPRGRRS